MRGVFYMNVEVATNDYGAALQRTSYDDHLRLIGKRTVDFPLVLIELFSLRVAAEALRANID